ncbi:hypothetical protein PUN28_003038 [Cardiocondyla obscurior]|uniref:Transmembrane protein 177 n=1 Tax=Cardiocondyla obscurior TaxID=286306 RepID=A0AAW2GX85_9HYME
MGVFLFRYRNVILGVTATAVGYCAVLTPHTVLLKKYRNIMARYQLGKEVPLNSNVQQQIQKVMNDLKLPDSVKNIIKPFSVSGFELFHAGTLNAQYGAILGMPINLTSTPEEIHENLQIGEEPIDWTRYDAQIFMKAVMLSEDAQKFAIAREILRLQAEEPFLNSFELALIIAMLWTLYNVISYRFKLKDNAIARRTLYTVFILFGAALWFGVKDYQSYQLDKENDKILCSLGLNYIKGGQEFYDKTLIRNKALRTLLGSKGKGIYTVYGNEETLLRQKHLPFSYSKDFFDSHLRKLERTK